MSKKKIKCKDTGETAKDYTAYLKTQHWEQLRVRVAKEYNYTCNGCGEYIPNAFEIHHLTYKRVGNEKIDDLVCLCRTCHQKETNRIKAQKEENKRLSNAPFTERVKHAKDWKAKVKLVFVAKKDIKKIFDKHFERFIKEVEKYEEKEAKK